VKKIPMREKPDSHPNARTSAPSDATQSANAIPTTAARRPFVKRACSGVGVSSSMIAGACVPDLPAECAGRANARGTSLPPIQPTTAAPATRAGNGTENTTSATNAASAMTASGTLRSVRDPMRQAAASTMATTAGFTPSSAAFTTGTWPKRT